VYVALLRAKRIVNELMRPLGFGRQEVELAVLRGGLECVISFLEKAEKLVCQVDIIFDEIDAAVRALRYAAIREIWLETGFDANGQRLPTPVNGLGLSADVLAIIVTLPEQQQINQLLERIAARLALRVSVEVEVKPLPAVEIQVGAVAIETTAQSATKPGKLGRPKQKPETDEYRFVEQLLRELNDDTQIKHHRYVASKEDLINVLESNPTVSSV
jgi:hypothetical protein